MKKIISILIAAIMLLSAFSAFADTTSEKMYIFVKAGAEGGDGTKANPFGTFEQARDKIREIKSNGQYPEGGVVVYFREGAYSITDSIKLTKEDSGTEAGPVVYRAYMEEQATIVGGVDLNVSDFAPVTDAEQKSRLNADAASKILAANLKDLGISDFGVLNIFGAGTAYFDEESGLKDQVNFEQPPELFYGDVIGLLARYPNEGYIQTGTIIDAGDPIENWSNVWKTSIDRYVPKENRTYPPKPSIYNVDPDTASRMKKWKNENDIWVYGYFGENWSDVSLPVKEADGEKGVITTVWPSPKKMKSDMNYYIYNVLGELDTPGEYYLDRDTGILYIYPPEGTEKVTMSTLNVPLIKIDGASHIKIKSFAIKGTRNDGITVTECDNVDFELCSISKIAGVAARVNNCFNCDFKSCHVYQIGSTGLSIGTASTDAGKEIQKNLTPQNNTVENCELHGIGRIKATYSPALSIGGVGNTARHCYVYDGVHMAVSFGGNDNTIEYCEFTDLLRTADDSGAIYGGYNKQYRGLKIVNNYFHDIASTSPKGTDISLLYPDDTNDGWIVEQNLFVNVRGRVMHSNGGSTHKVRNNIAINMNHFLNFGAHSSDLNGKYAWDKYVFQQYLDNPAYAKYENFSDLTKSNYLRVIDIETKNNVIWNVENDITTKADKSLNQMDPSYVIGADPGFVDMLNGDYTLREDSIIYSKYPEFKAPDFKNMGMYTGKAKALLGNGRAFLAGSAKVYNAFAPEAVNDRHDATPVIKDGVAYLPLRYVTETYGGEISYDDATAEITVNYSSPVIIKPGEYFTVNGTSLVSTEKISELFDMDVKAFANGVIVMGEEVKITDGDTKVLEELARRISNE